MTSGSVTFCGYCMSKPDTDAAKLIEVARAADLLYADYVTGSEGDPYHGIFRNFIDRCQNISDLSILEAGSRIIGGIDRRMHFGKYAEYTGVDIHDGPGVDVRCDIHDMSQFVPSCRYDAVFSLSVFEHLAFPWKAVMEINKVLKVGGLCFVATHPVWPPHELPWDFWRFPVAGISMLFSKPLGFRLVAASEGLPARVHSLVSDPPTRSMPEYEVNLGVAVLAEKIGEFDSDKFRWDVPLGDFTGSTYPRSR